MIEIYCDGGVYQQINKGLWAFIVVKKEEPFYSNTGSFNCSGYHREDVEKAESEAFKNAIDYVIQHPNNYVIYSDSRSFIDKIEKRCGNATKNPHVKYIQDTLQNIKGSPLPISLSIKWKERRSNKWMRQVDDLCEKTNLYD